MRFVLPTAIFAALALLGGCNSAQQPVDLASTGSLTPGMMPAVTDDADLARPDPRKISAIPSSASIMVETPEEAAGRRAQKQALLRNFNTTGGPSGGQAVMSATQRAEFVKKLDHPASLAGDIPVR